jgi:hypothetical protein
MKRKNWTNTDALGLSDTRDKSILMLDPKALAHTDPKSMALHSLDGRTLNNLAVSGIGP